MDTGDGSPLKHMFTSPRPNLYESSDGFSVEVHGRTGLCYREAGRQMFVDSEVLTGPSGIAVTRIQSRYGIYRKTACRSRIQIAAGFSTTFVKPFARKASRSVSYELARNSRVSDDLPVLQSAPGYRAFRATCGAFLCNSRSALTFCSQALRASICFCCLAIIAPCSASVDFNKAIVASCS